MANIEPIVCVTWAFKCSTLIDMIFHLKGNRFCWVVCLYFFFRSLSVVKRSLPIENKPLGNRIYVEMIYWPAAYYNTALGQAVSGNQFNFRLVPRIRDLSRVPLVPNADRNVNIILLKNRWRLCLRSSSVKVEYLNCTTSSSRLRTDGLTDAVTIRIDKEITMQPFSEEYKLHNKLRHLWLDVT